MPNMGKSDLLLSKPRTEPQRKRKQSSLNASQYNHLSPVKKKKKQRVSIKGKKKKSDPRSVTLNQLSSSLFAHPKPIKSKSRELISRGFLGPSRSALVDWVGDESMRPRVRSPFPRSAFKSPVKSFVSRSRPSTPTPAKFSPLDPKAYLEMLRSKEDLSRELGKWRKGLLPGVKEEPDFTWQFEDLSRSADLPDSVRIWHLRWREPAQSKVKAADLPTYKTLVYLEGSALWNKGYIDWAYKHATDMLEELGSDWQVLVIQHEMIPEHTYAEIQNQVSLAVDAIVRYADHFSVRMQSRAPSLPELYFMGYSSGANLMANALTQMIHKSSGFIDCIHQFFMISPVSLHRVDTSEAIETIKREIERTIQTRYSKMNYYIGHSFMNFLRCLVWRLDKSINTDVKIHAKLRSKTVMYSGKADTELGFQNKLSKANGLDLFLFKGNHGAWWDSFKEANKSGPTILKHLLEYLPVTAPDEKLSEEKSTCSISL
jgi:acetyl esterase/lipase